MKKDAWAICSDPYEMLHLWLRNRTTTPFKKDALPRRCRLLACALARQVQDHYRPEALAFLQLAERARDDTDTLAGMFQAWEELHRVTYHNLDSFDSILHSVYTCFIDYPQHGAPVTLGDPHPLIDTLNMVLFALGGFAWRDSPHREAEHKRQLSNVVREVLGNPWRGVVYQCAGVNKIAHNGVVQLWFNEPVVDLLAHAVNNRDQRGRHDSARLGVLADCLEEQGCLDQQLLDHLRSPGPHYRGCWALDYLNLDLLPNWIAPPPQKRK